MSIATITVETKTKGRGTGMPFAFQAIGVLETREVKNRETKEVESVTELVATTDADVADILSDIIGISPDEQTVKDLLAGAYNRQSRRNASPTVEEGPDELAPFVEFLVDHGYLKAESETNWRRGISISAGAMDWTRTFAARSSREFKAALKAGADVSHLPTE